MCLWARTPINVSVFIGWRNRETDNDSGAETGWLIEGAECWKNTLGSIGYLSTGERVTLGLVLVLVNLTALKIRVDMNICRKCVHAGGYEDECGVRA